MEKIYWSNEEGQIKTKGGKCVYDRGDASATASMLKTQVDTLAAELVKLKINTEGCGDCICKIRLQLACAHKGHKIVYARKDLSLLAPYVFGCSNCGLEITKTKKELTPSEREALKKLKVI